MSTMAKRQLRRDEHERASVEVAKANERKLIERYESQIEQKQQLLEAARKRLEQLEAGEITPSAARKPKPNDHVVSPRTGSLRRTV